MRAPPGSRTAQIVALWKSGELAKAARETRTQPEMCARFGMSADAYRQAVGGARHCGFAIPGYNELRRGYTATSGATDPHAAVDSEWDDEPTQQNIRSPFQEPAPTERVFDETLTPLPPLGAGVPRSTLIDADGNVRAQWIKHQGTRADPAEVIRAAFGGKLPRADLATPPAYSDDDLLCVYPMGDPHIGMLAWERDAGENFDLSIVERNLFAAVDRLVSLAPNSTTALIATVGDTFHSDGLNNTTTKGTRVDVDGRTVKMIATGVRVFRRVIDRALEKHARALVKIVPGNHDALLALVLQLMLAQFYEDEPRVEIDTSPEMFQWHRFGANLIGITHGDKANATNLMQVMASDRAKDWGETKHRRIYAGHIHHEVVKEMPGVTVEYLRTLASSDAWHRGQGYRSGRDMKLDVWHREHGHINRHIVGIEQIRSMQEQT